MKFRQTLIAALVTMGVGMSTANADTGSLTFTWSGKVPFDTVTPTGWKFVDIGGVNDYIPTAGTFNIKKADATSYSAEGTHMQFKLVPKTVSKTFDNAGVKARIAAAPTIVGAAPNSAIELASTSSGCATNTAICVFPMINGNIVTDEDTVVQTTSAGDTKVDMDLVMDFTAPVASLVQGNTIALTSTFIITADISNP
ncbi:hypothetical protein VP758_004970 [Vibrio harveyi]|nr:hypothetical protein [Vibrio harveyi]